MSKITDKVLNKLIRKISKETLELTKSVTENNLGDESTDESIRDLGKSSDSKSFFNAEYIPKLEINIAPETPSTGYSYDFSPSYNKTANNYLEEALSAISNYTESVPMGVPAVVEEPEPPAPTTEYFSSIVEKLEIKPGDVVLIKDRSYRFNERSSWIKQLQMLLPNNPIVLLDGRDIDVETMSAESIRKLWKAVFQKK